MTSNPEAFVAGLIDARSTARDVLATCISAGPSIGPHRDPVLHRAVTDVATVAASLDVALAEVARLLDERRARE